MSFSKFQKNHQLIFSIFLSLAIFAGFGNTANAYPIFAQQKCDLKLL
jgi:hypothetical protein